MAARNVLPESRSSALVERKRAGIVDRYLLLQAGLLVVRAGPALILLILVAAVALTTDVFLTSRNVGNVFSQTAVISVLALGQLLVIITRGIDLSVGATVALSSVVGALVYRDLTDSGALVILAILGTGLAVGAVNGLVYVYGRIPHPFIVTLATLSIAKGVALWAADGTLIPGVPPAVDKLGGSYEWLPYSFFLVLGLALTVLVLSRSLVWGRWLYAVGGSPEAARRTGIPVNRVLVTVYVLCGLAAGFGGVIVASQTASGSPTFGELAELDSIAAVIIGGAAFAGGRGHVGNALVGALTIGVIRNALNLHNVDAFYQLIVIGVVILIAVELDVIRGWLEDRFRMAQAARNA